MRVEITADELTATMTFITEFMCDGSRHMKNYGELVSIYERCSPQLKPEDDGSDDLRINKFAEDMRAGNWSDDIILIKQHVTIVDGIHRGVAYLLCVKNGVETSKLPRIYITEVK